jgi:hypothetical protein
VVLHDGIGDPAPPPRTIAKLHIPNARSSTRILAQQKVDSDRPTNTKVWSDTIVQSISLGLAGLMAFDLIKQENQRVRDLRTDHRACQLFDNWFLGRSSRLAG